MSGTLLSLVLLNPTQAGTATGPLVRLKGQGELTSDSRYHKIPKMALKTSGRHRLGTELIPNPTFLAGKKPGDSWVMSPDSVHRLVQALHDIEWTGDDPARYLRWTGTNPPRSRSLKVDKREVRLTLVETEGKSRVIKLAGNIEATDTGSVIRSGPNSWQDKWKHELEGTFRVEADGFVSELKLTDEFEVEGVFYNSSPTEANAGKNTRKGELTFSKPPTAPLSPEQKRLVMELLALLNEDDFATRVEATNELTSLAKGNESVIERILDLGVGNVDPETRLRARAIVERASED